MIAEEIRRSWDDVAHALHRAPPVDTAAAVMRPRSATDPPGPANLALVMRLPSARRDLRRILMVIGAIGRTVATPATASSGRVRTADVVGALMRADADVLARLLVSAGAIEDRSRIARFAVGIAAAGDRAAEADAEAVADWVRDVARLLRDDPA